MAFSSISFIIFSLLFTFNFNSVFVTSLSYNVRIQNRATQPLIIKCLSDEKFYGQQTINPSTIWPFSVTIGEETQGGVFCQMAIGNKHGLFKVFQFSRDKAFCNGQTCNLYTTQDGLCFDFGNKCVIFFKFIG